MKMFKNRIARMFSSSSKLNGTTDRREGWLSDGEPETRGGRVGPKWKRFNPIVLSTVIFFLCRNVFSFLQNPSPWDADEGGTLEWIESADELYLSTKLLYYWCNY